MIADIPGGRNSFGTSAPREYKGWRWEVRIAGVSHDSACFSPGLQSGMDNESGDLPSVFLCQGGAAT